jgi:hypothetical protein
LKPARTQLGICFSRLTKKSELEHSESVNVEAMSDTITIAGIEIPKADWEATPASVQAVVMVLSERLSHIEEQLKQTSRNSSRPPSSDRLRQSQPKSEESPSNKNHASRGAPRGRQGGVGIASPATDLAFMPLRTRTGIIIFLRRVAIVEKR